MQSTTQPEPGIMKSHVFRQADFQLRGRAGRGRAARSGSARHAVGQGNKLGRQNQALSNLRALHDTYLER